MKVFEYTTYAVDGNLHFSAKEGNQSRALNTLGAQGWEICASFHAEPLLEILILKRELG